ncbi:putative HTH-type transcriptional regulator YwqM [Ktedonobacter sp. SOSP1-85]|uniref:LysR family transcriptional regulator n=1 Tax=Ktedonobacter sp. SOSP1-85 TaxID=2778367 RepID=UPI00191522C9|nr:LysR family transcriptional regulator [Ktedonobacter sp. SOSP1-85]GHO81604.1 putative HTH-type transcriptional regulator YwqM [Ktedonobacter sp. SOSP1-85]
MDFIYLQTFCEVAKWGNFTRAAEALGYSQPSVTTQIQKLEEQYGAVLFERYGRRMRPTQAGEVLLPYAHQILALQAEARARIAEQQTGTLLIGTIETLAAFYLPPVLQTFRETHPDIIIGLQSGNEASIVQAVKDGACDLGLILDRVTENPELVCVPLRKEEFAIITRPDSPYSQLAEVKVQDLAHARLILTEEGCTYRALLLQALKQSSITHQIACEFNSLEAIKQCVLGGLGIAFLPYVTVQEEVAQGKLRALPFAYTSHLYTQVIYLERKWRSQAFQSLLDVMGHYEAPQVLSGL